MTQHLPRVLATLLFTLLLVPVFQPEARAAGQPMIVIVGIANPLKDASAGMLRRAFQNEGQEYATGKRLIPINQPPGSPAREQFDRAVLGLKPDEIGRFWIDRRIRAQGGPPKTVPSSDLAVRLVMALPGAIAYVTADLLNDKVRALTIEGKAAGAVGYLLEQ